MKTILFAMTFLAISSSTFAGDTAGNGTSGATMSKNCVGTKAGAGAGAFVGVEIGIATGASLSTWFTGAACAASIISLPFTGGLSTPAVATICTATAAAVGATAVIGGGIAGAKLGEQAGKLADGAGCE